VASPRMIGMIGMNRMDGGKSWMDEK